MNATRRHVHQPPGTEVRAPWGEYTVRREGRIPYDDRDVLYVLADIAVGSACRGTATGRILIVPGYIGTGGDGPREENPARSRITPVRTARDRGAITRILRARVATAAVVFPP
ncbi:MAG: hypothetical protein M0P04_11175 [Syntrophales bacterium]|nr:hypothetical protein [Syntrophales bacterium]MDD4338205.1 hypothetical protein [Syntrophales bacterium]HPB70292.1 hypothetical protein [Syntrophales bacterium]HQN25539.1 hypothetical protein [Syntrophales bacterium]HQP29147.1 hypothetical protein [Syntrophales bacterium]